MTTMNKARPVRGEPEQAPAASKIRIVEIPDFLPVGPCRDLVGFFLANIGQLGGHNATPAFSHRQINYARIPNTEPVKNLMNQCRWRIADVIREAYGARQVYPNYTDLVHWPVGKGMGVHADNAYEDGSPNQFPWRTYSAVLYLNDEYEGGATYFPGPGIEVQPAAGKLIVFGAGIEFRHGVRPISGGDRYTMPLWFTDHLGHVEL